MTGWGHVLVAVAMFVCGCVTGWCARRDVARMDACIERCAPVHAVMDGGKCFCATEARP